MGVREHQEAETSNKVLYARSCPAGFNCKLKNVPDYAIAHAQRECRKGSMCSADGAVDSPVKEIQSPRLYTQGGIATATMVNNGGSLGISVGMSMQIQVASRTESYLQGKVLRVLSFSENSVTFSAPDVEDGIYFNVMIEPFTLGRVVKCPPGTSQELQGQYLCNACPQGKICETAGMQTPKDCPAGYICDPDVQIGESRFFDSIISVPSLQLAVGSRLATNFCPPGHYCPVGTASEMSKNKIIGLMNGIFQESYETHPWEGWLDPSGELEHHYVDVDGTGTAKVGLSIRDQVKKFRQNNLDFTLPQYCESNAFQVSPKRPCSCTDKFYCRMRTTSSREDAGARSFTNGAVNVCYSGFECERGSSLPEGQGACPKGFYCPAYESLQPAKLGRVACDAGNR